MYNTINVLYPSLLAVGGVTCDMYECIVRQDSTGAQFHALGWTTAQRLFILSHLKGAGAWNSVWLCKFCKLFPLKLYDPLLFAQNPVPSMFKFYKLLIFFFKEKAYLWWLYQYCTHFQYYQRHLWLNFFKI